MRFREYYLLEVKIDDIFEKSFQKFYRKGFFGNIEESLVKQTQRLWYEKLVRFIIEKNYKELELAIGSIENKISREYFSAFTGVNVKHKTKKDTLELLKNYIGG